MDRRIIAMILLLLGATTARAERPAPDGVLSLTPVGETSCVVVETAAAMSLDGATSSAKAPESPTDESEETFTTGLESPRPNPSNPSTEIRFSLAKEGPVRLVIYNQRGEKVWELPERVHAAGQHVVHWRGLDTSGADVASGVYFLRMQAEGRIFRQRLTLVR